MSTHTRDIGSVARLERLGIDYDDAVALRRVSMTLNRWHELECGTGDADTSVWVERDDTGKPWRHNQGRYGNYRIAIPDRETGALRRLEAIMQRYPSLIAYVQGDPRGASLYILRPEDIPEGASVDSCYSRGVAVYK